MSLKVWSLILAINITEMGFADRLAKRDDYKVELDPNMIRQDLTMKSNQGYLGQIKDNKGYTMTEQSIDVDIDGKKVLMPLLVPGLNNEEIASIKENKPLDSAYDKAEAHGKQRIKEGKSPFFEDKPQSIVLESDDVPIGNVGKEVQIDNQVRNKLYPGEDKYFKENPNVGGMMTEDNKVIINPYSNLTDNEKQAVIKNEKIRLNFKENNIVPDIDITEEQRALFKGTPYENNEDAIKQTIVARIMTGDPSANATKEQTMVANKTLTQTLLKEKGYTPTAIAGIMANIDVETGGTFNFQEKQRGGKGYGVFQFDFLNPYYQKYLEKSEKKDSLESQIDFMHETVYGNEQNIIGAGNAKKLREGLENAKTPEEAAEIFMNIFEKPGVPHLERRIESSKKFGGDLGINKANPITVTEEDVSD